MDLLAVALVVSIANGLAAGVLAVMQIRAISRELKDAREADET